MNNQEKQVPMILLSQQDKKSDWQGIVKCRNKILGEFKSILELMYILI